MLTDASIKGKTDTLQGLKENVIVGKLIPCVQTVQDITLVEKEELVVEQPLDENYDEEEDIVFDEIDFDELDSEIDEKLDSIMDEDNPFEEFDD